MRLLLAFVFWLIAASAQALDLSPSLLRHIEQQNWNEALADNSGNAALRSYLLWRAYQDDAFYTDFGSIAAFMDAHSDWPELNRLQVRAEKLLFQSGGAAGDVQGWLNKRTPISGYGMLALARIKPDTTLVRQGWIQGDFESGDESRILSEFAQSLTPETHRARAERLLSENKASIAQRLLPLVGENHASLYRARIALQRDENGVEGFLSRVPEALKGDHGLLADRLFYRHKRDLDAGVRELLMQMRPDSPYADALWRIRAAQARDAIEARSYNMASDLLEKSGVLNAANQADALWLKGWLELVFRSNPKHALRHFNQLYSSVQFPVSKSRGAYWSARAAQAMGDGSAALKWYQRAGEHPTVFYGQLALAELAPNKPLSLPDSPSADSRAVSRYRNHALFALIRAFHAADAYALASPLLSHLIESASGRSELAALMQVCAEHKMLHAQVKVAKGALQKGIIFKEGWPLAAVPSDAPLPPAIALAISRQESEFNARAISSANARGMMQLLPTTAQKTAKKIGADYSLEKLFDPQYNMRLGSQYLSDLIAGFDGSYILAIAGYNAGPGRSRQWVERFGSPGDSLEQTLTFIELIPFSETRNYVQRVLENVQMYRARIDPSAPLLIKKDLLR